MKNKTLFFETLQEWKKEKGLPKQKSVPEIPVELINDKFTRKTYLK